jgi:alkanesulfonate monooxygenase SsuD/methylene tetrahydromethanopterin reductase-like flavin-dependent oxidoreductase (luciferase family)
MRTGVWLYPIATAHELVDAVVRLDACGIDEVWIADEGVAREPFSILAAAARETSRITLAVGITSPLLRHPGAVAATAKTVDELSDGRVILGWGVGGNESLGPFSITSKRPVGVVRDALTMAKAVMQGNPIPGYEPPSHRSPPRLIRQFVGARGPQLNRLASESADGVFLSGLTEDEIPTVISQAHSVKTIDVALYQSVSFTGSSNERCIAGRAEEIEAKMINLNATYRPFSIGLALVDRLPITELVDRSLEVLSSVRSIGRQTYD